MDISNVIFKAKMALEQAAPADADAAFAAEAVIVEWLQPIHDAPACWIWCLKEIGSLAPAGDFPGTAIRRIVDTTQAASSTWGEVHWALTAGDAAEHGATLWGKVEDKILQFNIDDDLSSW